MLKPNISCSESTVLNTQMHPCAEEFVHRLFWRASANGSQPRKGLDQVLLIPLGIEGWILHSVTLIWIQDNSFGKGLIHCKAAGNGLQAGSWAQVQGTQGRYGAMKSPLLLPCTCALTALQSGSVPLGRQNFPSQAECEPLFWRAYK